ncbi:MAG: response regulator [Nitrospirota bacterium]|nr:response regulator [Nitrospirota bacterium]
MVDDDSSVAEMLKTALNVWGYNVILASNGREGLHVLDRQIVDGILLDVDMPVMDGPTMLDEVRWLGCQMPVVVMSGGFDERALRKLVKKGAQGFAFKPFPLRSLQELCATFFERDRLGVGSDDHAYVS